MCSNSKVYRKSLHQTVMKHETGQNADVQENEATKPLIITPHLQVF